MTLAIALLIGAGFAALIDLALHVLQLWPRLVPSQAWVQCLTFTSGALLALSCITAFNAGALIMGIGIMALVVFSLCTGKEID